MKYALFARPTTRPAARGAPRSSRSHRARRSRLAWALPFLLCLLLGLGAHAVKGWESEVHWTARELVSAASSGDLEAVRRLIGAGVDVNAKDTLRCYALIGAAERGDAEIVKLLVAAGADLNVRRMDNGRTALMEAARAGHVDAVRQLLHAGADTEAVDPIGWRALILATTTGQTSVVRELLRSGADPHRRSKTGSSALSIAVERRGSEVVVALLREAGAELSIQNLLVLAVKAHDAEQVRELVDRDNATRASNRARRSSCWQPAKEISRSSKR